MLGQKELSALVLSPGMCKLQTCQGRVHTQIPAEQQEMHQRTILSIVPRYQVSKSSTAALSH